MSHIFAFSHTRQRCTSTAAKPASKSRITPMREPVAAQIRNYYTLLHTDYVALQRQAALARVQQALEPLTVALLS